MYIKKIIYKSCSFLVLLSLFLTMLPNSVAAADDEYLWILSEIVESAKESEIAEYNTVNTELYQLSVAGSEGSYSFLLNYLGNDLDQGESGRHFKKGDSASSLVTFSNIPSVIKQNDSIEINLEAKITNDTTYDKTYEFLGTQGIAFFDKSGAQPDIPSSDAVYFTENADEAVGTSVGTKSDAKTTISTKMYATAPKGSSEGQKISLCLCASGTVAVGTIYIYEWLPSDEQYNLDPTIKERVITLSDLNGQVSVRNDMEEVSGENAMSLSKGNRIIAGEASTCALSFNDGSSFNLKQNSQLWLRETYESNTVVKLLSGSAWAHIKTSSEDSIFKIETNFAVLALQGATFAVEENDENTVVWIFSSTADFTSAVTGEIVNLKYGEKAIFDKNGKLTKENFVIKDASIQWGIPLSIIVEDNGYSDVDKFIYVLIVVLIFCLIAVFISFRNNKRRRIRRISKAIPDSGECIFCGKKLDADAMFCSGCGAAVKKQKNNKSSEMKSE